jgi:peptidyl-prolyl cis-trans isomerase D
VLQAALPDPAVADAFINGKAAGKTLDQLLTETGVSLTDMGTIAKSEILNPALANAAFSLAAGDFTVIPGIGGRQLVAVMAIEAGGTPLLDEVRADISQRLALTKARASYIDTLDQVEELMAAFQPFEDIATRFGLEVATVDLGATGAELAAVPEIAEMERGRVAAAIFAANPDARLNPVIAIGANNNVWFDVTATSPARDRTLDEVRDDVLAAWTEEQTQDALTAEVQKVLADLDAGTPLADVASALGQFPVPSGELNRATGDGSPQIDAQVAAAAFAGGPGHHGAAQNADGDYIVFEVTGIAPAGETAEAEADVKDATIQSLYSDFVTAVRNDVGVRENAAVLNQLLALDTGG